MCLHWTSLHKDKYSLASGAYIAKIIPREKKDHLQKFVHTKISSFSRLCNYRNRNFFYLRNPPEFVFVYLHVIDRTSLCGYAPMPADD